MTMRLFLVPIIMLLAAAAPAAAQQTLKVGAFVTLSGVSSDVGNQMKSGIEVAVERMAKDFTIGGKPAKVQVIWYDDEGKADTGLNVVTRALTVDKIDIGIGFLSSDVFVRVMDEFQKASVPVVTCCSASLAIGDKIARNKMEYVFQLSPTASDIATGTVEATARLAKPAKVALLNENTDAGRDFSRISRAWLAANAPSAEVVSEDFVPRGVTDLTPQLVKYKRLGADAIIGDVYGSSAPVLYDGFNELRIPALLASMGTSTSSDSFVSDHAREMEGSLVNIRWVPGDYTPLTRQAVDAFRAKTGFSPSSIAIQAHDTALVALTAVSLAGSVDPAAVAAKLEQTTFLAAWGERRFTPLSDGHRMPVKTIVAQVQDGKKVVVFPAGPGSQAFRPLPPYSWQR